MFAIPRNILSVLLTLMFGVVSITGVLLFFHIKVFSTEFLHIWIGLAFVLISLLHLLKNWASFTLYFKKKSTRIATASMIIILSLIVAMPLLDSQEKVNPKGAILSAVMNAPLSQVAPLFNSNTEDIIKNLEQQHIIVRSEQTIEAILKTHKNSSNAILQTIFIANSPK